MRFINFSFVLNTGSRSRGLETGLETSISVISVGGFQHSIAGSGVRIPAGPRLDVHRTQLPLPQRVVDASFEPPWLLLLAHQEGVFVLLGYPNKETRMAENR
jgi:hypothetical protein